MQPLSPGGGGGFSPDAILSDSHVDTIDRIKMMYSDDCGCTEAVRVCRRSVERERKVRKIQLETLEMTAL